MAVKSQNYDILVFGSDGRLGRRICSKLQEDQFLFISYNRKQLDVRDLVAVRGVIEARKPKWVINCTAKNGLEACLENPSEAYLVNAIAPMDMAIATNKIGAKFIHFSTDYTVTKKQVTYEGIPEEPSESYIPVSEYGFSKRWGEKLVWQHNKQSLIFRLSSLYSSSDMAGALGPIRDWLSGKGRSPEDPIKVLDQRTTPTSVETIAKMTMSMIRYAVAPGLYNLTPSWAPYEVDRITKMHFGIRALNLFYGVKEAQFQFGQLAIPRPPISLLDNSKFCMAYGSTMPSVWESLMDEFIVWRANQTAHIGNVHNSPSPSSSA